MFNRKFWRDAAEAFVIAALCVVVMDPTAIIAAGSVEQLVAAAVALGRAAAVAGFAAIAPRFVAMRDRRKA